MLFVIFAQEREHQAALEEEEKKKEARQDRIRFMAVNPFKDHPRKDCLEADPSREQAQAMWDFEQMMRHREKEEGMEFATVESLRNVRSEAREDRDEIFQLASQAFYEVGDLEKRLNAVLGPIPYLPDM